MVLMPQYVTVLDIYAFSLYILYMRLFSENLPHDHWTVRTIFYQLSYTHAT